LFFREKVLDRQARTTGIHDGVGLVIDDLLEVLRRHSEQMAHLVRERTEKPDVHDRHCEHDMPESLAAHRLRRHFDAAAVADDPFVANTLVLSAIALPIARGSEDLLAKETVFFRAV